MDYEFVDDSDTWTLEQARFTRDVAVDGLVLPGPDGVWTADLDVRSPGGRVTAVQFSGPFLTYGEQITITADFGGGTATFTVPAY